MVSEIPASTVTVGAGAKGGLTPDFLTLSYCGSFGSGLVFRRHKNNPEPSAARAGRQGHRPELPEGITQAVQAEQGRLQNTGACLSDARKLGETGSAARRVALTAPGAEPLS